MRFAAVKVKMVVLSRPICGLLSIDFASSRGLEPYKGKIDVYLMRDNFIGITPEKISHFLTPSLFSHICDPIFDFAGRQPKHSSFRQGLGTPAVKHFADLHRIMHQHAFPQLKVGVVVECGEISPPLFSTFSKT